MERLVLILNIPLRGYLRQTPHHEIAQLKFRLRARITQEQLPLHQNQEHLRLGFLNNPQRKTRARSIILPPNHHLQIKVPPLRGTVSNLHQANHRIKIRQILLEKQG